MNGGRKEDFESMNKDDIQLIYTTHLAYQNHLLYSLSDSISKIFGGN